MKERPITMLRGETAIIDEDDFGRIKPHSWYINGGYPVARINGKRVYLHAFLLGAAPSGFHIDHINRDKLDNRRSNLRVITIAENIRNRRSYKGEENPFFKNKHSAKTCIKIAARFSKAVTQLSLDGAHIKEWPSAMDAQRALGISNANITEVVSGNRKTAGGFIWSRQ